MRLEIDIPEHQYNNIMSIDSISLGRAPYKGIIMYAINAIKQGKVLEQEPTTKNNLGVEYISRSELMAILSDYYDTTVEYRSMLKEIAALPVVIQEPTTKNNLEVAKAIEILKADSITGYSVEDVLNARDMAIKALEQEPQTFKWCTDCREYDQEKHCCHRWSKVIRDTVEEMKQGRCDKCEVGNPCLYCKHEFEPQESEET